MTTASTLWTWFVAATIAWSAAAFGAVYPWAYAPVLIAAAALGTAAVLSGRGAVPWTVALALGAVALIIALQLAPLSVETITTVSPNAMVIHKQRNLLAASGALDSYTLSIEPRQTKIALAFVVALSLLLVGGARLLTRHSARHLAFAIAIIGVALAVVALVGRVSFHGRIYGFWTPDQPAAPLGPFVNRNHFAGWMLMALPLTIGLFAATVSRGMGRAPSTLRDRLMWLATPDAGQAILAAFAVLAMAMALVVTLSRSGIVAMAGAMVVAATMMARRESSHRRYLTPAYLAGVAVFAILWVGAGTVAARFEAPGLIDAQGRRAIWADAARMIQDFWLTGTGLNTFGVASLYYQTAFAGVHVREAHNDLLQLAAEGGVIGAVPIVIGVAALATRIRKRLRSDEGSIWWIRAGATTGLLAIAAQSLVDFSLQIPANALLFSVICAVALHDGGRRVRRGVDPAEPPTTDRLDRVSPGNEAHGEKVVKFSVTNRELTFAFDDDEVPYNAAGAQRADLELADLDHQPLAIKSPSQTPFRGASYHALRRGASQQPRTLVLAAALALGLFVLLLLAIAGGVHG